MVESVEERKKQAKYLTDKRILKDNPQASKETAIAILQVSPENYDLIKGENNKPQVKPISEVKILWDKELQDYKEEQVEWVVNRFIKPKSINILGGKRSTLKSWLGMNLGYCISTGNLFLDKFTCKQGRVLYFDRENGFSELKKRSLMVKKGLNILEGEIAFLSETDMKLDNYLNLQMIKEFVIQNNIVLIIVDTYRRVISFKEDNADEVSQFFVDMIKPLSEETGVSFLFIHHEKKGESQGDDMDMLRGSSDLANYVDTIVQIERKGDYLTIKHTKQRTGKELEPFSLKVDTDEINYFRFEYKGETQNRETTISKDIVEWVIGTDRKQFRYKEVIELFEGKGYKKSNIINSLKSLVNKGFLKKENHYSPYVVCNQNKLDSEEV